MNCSFMPLKSIPHNPIIDPLPAFTMLLCTFTLDRRCHRSMWMALPQKFKRITDALVAQYRGTCINIDGGRKLRWHASGTNA